MPPWRRPHQEFRGSSGRGPGFSPSVGTALGAGRCASEPENRVPEILRAAGREQGEGAGEHVPQRPLRGHDQPEWCSPRSPYARASGMKSRTFCVRTVRASRTAAANTTSSSTFLRSPPRPDRAGIAERRKEMAGEQHTGEHTRSPSFVGRARPSLLRTVLGGRTETTWSPCVANSVRPAAAQVRERGSSRRTCARRAFHRADETTASSTPRSGSPRRARLYSASAARDGEGSQRANAASTA